MIFSYVNFGLSPFFECCGEYYNLRQGVHLASCKSSYGEAKYLTIFMTG